MVSYRDIETAFANTGLVVRGGFETGADDDPAKVTVVMVGNVGSHMWSRFSSQRDDVADPLDTWTKSVVGPRADTFGATAVYPNDKPYRPFQQWAMRAEPVSSSPLGILIHPTFGLWHAYRAALIFDRLVADLPANEPVASPCDACAEKPCLCACPVGAFSAGGYDVPTCVGHLKTPVSEACHAQGCLARLACPVGSEHRTPEAQRAFHAAAFFRSNG